MKKLMLLASLVLAFTACGKKGDDSAAKTKEFAGFCAEADKQLKDTASADDETFKMQMSNMMKACSTACNGKDDASCKILDEGLGKICGVSVTVCDRLCDSATDSLKTAACAHDSKN